MGMAASQARYLALVARKSNCEYEGQQINQSRLILSNQSANLFNQMLGLQVPVSPSKMDYTKTQYSYKDGMTTYTMDEWTQLAEEDSDGYNYVVTYHYNTDVQEGSQKMKSNPQIKYNGSIPNTSTVLTAQVTAIENALKDITAAQEALKTAKAELDTLTSKAAILSTYADYDTYNSVTKCVVTADKTGYTVTPQKKDANDYLEYYYTHTVEGTETTDYLYYDTKTKTYNTRTGTGTDTDPYEYEPVGSGVDTSVYKASDDTPVTYTSYTALKESGSALATKIESAVDELKAMGALKETDDYSIAFADENGNIAFKSDFELLVAKNKSYLPLYYYDNKPADSSYVNIKDMTSEIALKENAVVVAKRNLDIAENSYNVLDYPNYIGNTELTPISELNEDQLAKIAQIITDMKDQGIDTNILKCFSTMDGMTYDNSTYIGGLYTYEQNGVTYYTTYYDLAASVLGGEGINNIDNQKKLPVYTVSKVTRSIDKTEKAVLESDTSGRFISIRLESDSLKYDLSVETAVDEIAYEDAMNEYDYNKAVYDKRVSDLNAQTSIIQRQDQDLELRLKQLDTEQNALNTEIDAVSKVVKDNVEKSFKTFGG